MSLWLYWYVHLPMVVVNKLIRLSRTQYSLFQDNKSRIFTHRLRLEYPRWPEIGDPWSHYVGLFRKWGSYYLARIVWRGTRIEEKTISNSVLGACTDIISIPGNRLPEHTVIYLSCLDKSIRFDPPPFDLIDVRKEEEETWIEIVLPA